MAGHEFADEMEIAELSLFFLGMGISLADLVLSTFASILGIGLGWFTFLPFKIGFVGVIIALAWLILNPIWESDRINLAEERQAVNYREENQHTRENVGDAVHALRLNLRRRRDGQSEILGCSRLNVSEASSTIHYGENGREAPVIERANIGIAIPQESFGVEFRKKLDLFGRSE